MIALKFMFTSGFLLQSWKIQAANWSQLRHAFFNFRTFWN